MGNRTGFNDTVTMHSTPSVAFSEIDGLRARIAALEQSVQEHSAQMTATAKDLADFSHSISHDLRAPLRGIAGFTRILIEDHGAQLDDEGRRNLYQIQGEARRMTQHIDDLIAFARVGRQPLDAGEVNMTELVRCTFDQLAEQPLPALPRLEVAPLPQAFADRMMMRQVLAQLLANTIKFTRHQPAARVDVTAVTEGEWNTYCVADNGVGFDQRYAHRLFGVFQRLHGPEEFPGTGVGLAVVRRIVQRHGGRVWAEGKVDGGAKFYFTLPHGGRTTL
jgi:light-regulated signal transduction histidine kinase (bacteriophytochrome)